ncbi:unnamed protein product, partial [Brenthis ino]
MDKSSQEQDCAICLQKCHHPTQLPCGHVFCFLCVKGIAIQSKKCAMCRMQIPSDYFDHPVLIEKSFHEETCMENGSSEKYQWYYEGRNGWWKYDERSNIDLETAYNTEETECLLLLAGTIYCVDFENMIQFRRSDPRRRRRVKRDVPTLPSKGIAGIKNIDTAQSELSNNASDLVTNDVNIIENETNDSINDVENETNTHESDNTRTIVEPYHAIEEVTDNLRHINIHSEDPISFNSDETNHPRET